MKKFFACLQHMIKVKRSETSLANSSLERYTRVVNGSRRPAPASDLVGSAGAIIVVLVIVVGIALKRKDVRS